MTTIAASSRGSNPNRRRLLRERVEAAKQTGPDVSAYEPLHAIPAKVAQDAAHYTNEARIIAAWREHIATAIEELAQ